MCKCDPSLCEYCFESLCYDESDIEFFQKTCDKFFINHQLKYISTYISFSVNGKKEKNVLYLLSLMSKSTNYPILVSDEILLWITNTFNKKIFTVPLEYIGLNEDLENLCDEFNRKYE